MPSVKFFTLGCKVNQYETQQIRERFLESGFEEAGNNKAADIFIVNTCTVTRKANKDSLYFVHRSHRENPKAKIIVTGCMAGSDRLLLEKQPGVCRVILNKDKSGIIKLFYRKAAAVKDGISRFEGHTRAFVKVQDGCDNFCSYCKIPLVRGRSRSRRAADIVPEVRRLAANGYKEIVLTGICLGAYGRDLKPRRTLAWLIESLEKIPGLSRIRLSSIEAGDVTSELIALMTRSQKLCPHLHIPIQSGDDEILRKMNRRYSRADYLALIRKIRMRIPDIAITTDVLVGFPGETQAQFKNTVDLVKKIRPLRTHIFPFSPRPGTAAERLADRISQEMARQRTALLAKVARKSALLCCRQFIGKTAEVLFEQQKKTGPGLWEGYTRHYVPVIMRSAKDLQNRIVKVCLQEVSQDGIKAKKMTP